MNVVLALAAGRDVFAVLPTGYGKSLCYAGLPVMFDRLDFVKSNHSIVVVVTPLNAIIRDQRITLSARSAALGLDTLHTFFSASMV